MTLVPAPAVAIVPELDPLVRRELNQLDKVRSDWVRPLSTIDDYLRGDQVMRFLGSAAREQFGSDVEQLVLNFPELIVDAHNDRLDVEGFRFPDEAEGSDDLWAIWQANNLDEGSVMAHFEALGLGRAAIIVGPGSATDDAPVITAESPFDVSWVRDPRSGVAVLGQKRWSEDDGSQWMTLYEPNRRLTITLDRGGWRVTGTFDHGFGRSLLVPLVNRARVNDRTGLRDGQDRTTRDGRSEFAAVMPIADAANKIASDMMISAEYHAMPRRWAFGLKKSDFQNADGTRKSMWSFVKGNLWANENPDVKVGQFPESSLTNFHDTIKLLTRTVGMLTAMPIDYMAFDSVNPPSADALRSAESRLVKRVERRQVAFGGAWEEAMRLALLLNGSGAQSASRIETVWRDPATPTIAQKYDAIVKAVVTRGADGRPLVPTEQARIDLGYTPAQRADMARMEQDAAEADPVVKAAQSLGLGDSGARSSS